MSYRRPAFWVPIDVGSQGTADGISHGTWMGLAGGVISTERETQLAVMYAVSPPSPSFSSGSFSRDAFSDSAFSFPALLVIPPSNGTSSAAVHTRRRRY